MVEYRLRTARARSKARDQLRELLRDTSLIHSLVVACNSDEQWMVLVGGMTPAEMGEALLVGTTALSRYVDHEASVGGIGSRISLDARTPIEPLRPSTGRKREPEITRDAEGEMHAPGDESFTYCAECGASRWYATVLPDGSPGRLACVRCGNEIKMIRVYDEGIA